MLYPIRFAYPPTPLVLSRRRELSKNSLRVMKSDMPTTICSKLTSHLRDILGGRFLCHYANLVIGFCEFDKWTISEGIFWPRSNLTLSTSVGSQQVSCTQTLYILYTLHYPKRLLHMQYNLCCFIYLFIYFCKLREN